MLDGLDSPVVLALVAALCAASCAPPDKGTTGGPGVLADVPDSAPSLVVDVGTGFGTFMPVQDGDPVDVSAGPQGGFHIWTSVRVHDVTVDSVKINVTSRFDDGRLAGTPSSWAATLDPPQDGTRAHDGMTNFVTSPESVRGKRVTLRAEVVTSDGRHGADQRVVVPR